MKKCVDCKYIRKCKSKAECPDLWGCTSGFPVEKMGIRTNGDAIRAMDNEELAEFFTKQFCHGIGENLIMEWLESEVNNG